MPRRATLPRISSEFAAAELGDERLRLRLLTIARAAEASPSLGFPQMAGSDGELEGVYRFLGNERVTAEAILEPHFQETLSRAGREDVLVVHDTTTFKFGGKSPREGLGWIHKETGSQGFFGHFALAVSGDGSRRPLGLIGLSQYVREGKPLGRKVTGRERYERESKESARWADLALRVHDRLPTAVHVMDREADSFELFETLTRVGARFVIRVREAMNRIALDEGVRVPLSEIAPRAAVRLRRRVPLSRRHKSPLAPRNKIHPPRSERTASLEVRGMTLTIPRPWHQSRRIEPRHLILNFVWVVEKNPPAGHEPVSWMLVTTEPISMAADLERIIDAYRARWIIEELFKALKTGCAFEKRQLESLHALMNALAVFTVVAWKLLLLRAVARATPRAPAETAITARQVRLLEGLTRLRDPRIARIQMPPRPSAADALRAIAALGGHLKNNGQPGWQVLGRGYDTLLLLELGWRAREEM